MNLFRAISNLLRFDRTNWKALALCLFAASVFWTFNALNKSYSTNVRFPLQFEFDQAKFIAVEPLPTTITMNVSGNGWELFRRSYGLKVPNIQMPLERPADMKKIVAATLSPIVASQIGALQMNYIVTDTLRLKIESKISRTIRLYASLKNVSFEKKFGRSGPVVILPDSVILEGPKSLLEALHDSLVIYPKASSVDNNFRENVEIVPGNTNLFKRNPPVAEVMFDVGLTEEITQNVRLRLPKPPWGTELDRDSVRCVFIIPQKDRQQFAVDAASLYATFDIGNIKKGEVKSFYPTILGMPAYASFLLSDSIKVKKY